MAKPLLLLDKSRGLGYDRRMVRIYINRHVVAANQKSGERNPPITIYRQGRREYALAVEIIGSSRVVYSPDRPLSCGARVWIEAEDARVNDAAFYERLAARTKAKPKRVPAPPPKAKPLPAPLLAKPPPSERVRLETENAVA